MTWTYAGRGGASRRTGRCPGRTAPVGLMVRRLRTRRPRPTAVDQVPMRSASPRTTGPSVDLRRREPVKSRSARTSDSLSDRSHRRAGQAPTRFAGARPPAVRRARCASPRVDVVVDAGTSRRPDGVDGRGTSAVRDVRRGGRDADVVQRWQPCRPMQEDVRPGRGAGRPTTNRSGCAWTEFEPEQLEPGDAGRCARRPGALAGPPAPGRRRHLVVTVPPGPARAPGRTAAHAASAGVTPPADALDG